MSVRIAQRREEAQARATLARIEESGLTEGEYYAAIGAAYLAWSARYRFLPRVLRNWTFDTFGGRLAGRFIASWKVNETDLHNTIP